MWIRLAVFRPLVYEAMIYFDHMTKMKILNGRMLTDEDVRARKKVVVIDEMAKDKVFQKKSMTIFAA